MGIFSRRKSKQANEAPPKQDDKPAAAPYKHVPRHAGADSVVLGGNAVDRKAIALQHNMRMNSGKNEAVPTAGIAQMLAHDSPQSPIRRTPSPFGQQQRSPFGASPRFQIGEVFTTDPDAPPLPMSPLLDDAKAGKLPRNGSGYFARSSRDLPPPARSSMRGSSREPQGKLPRNNSGFLPELSLGDDLSEEPAFSTQAMSDYGTSNTAASERNENMTESKSENGTPARRRSWSRKGSKTRTKQTRFEETTEPAPAPALAPVTTPVQVQMPTRESPERLRKRHSMHAPEVQHPVDREAESQPEGWQPASDPRDSLAPEVYSEDMHQQTNVWPQRDPRSEHPYQLPQPEQLVSPMLGPVAPVLPQQQQQPEPFIGPPRPRSPAISQSTESRINSSHSSHTARPALSTLEGLKVNKRGRILDEEGDPIGELVEGDIMDCVRQKANANGEVLDEHGVVVGRVVTITDGEDSPYLRAMSPPPLVQQSNGYFNQHYQNGFAQQYVSRGRRESDVSAMALPGSQTQSLYAPEAQRAPPDFSTMVELDASEIVQAAPVLDHSDIFLPDFQRAKSPSRWDGPSEKDATEGAQARKRESPTRPQRSNGESFVVDEPKKASPPRSSFQDRNLNVPLAEEEPTFNRSRSPGLPQTQPARPASLQGLTRSVSDNALTTVSRESSRRMVRMDPVPEMTAAEGLPERSPVFSYKGNIPLTDGPGVINVHGANGKPSMQRPVSFDSQTPRSVPALSSISPKNQLALGGQQRLSPNPPMSLQTQRTAYKSRYSTNQPLVRSPLSSHESTPPESDKSASDDGTLATSLGFSSSRPPSIRTMHSTMSTSSKPRTYFTHTGRVTVEDGERKEVPRSMPLSRTASRNSVAQSVRSRSQSTKGEGRKSMSAAGAGDMTVAEKKKSRFSFSLGRKDKVAA